MPLQILVVGITTMVCWDWWVLFLLFFYSYEYFYGKENSLKKIPKICPSLSQRADSIFFFREIQQKFGIISKNPSENFCRSSIVFFSFGDFSWFVFSIIFYGFLWGLLKVFLVELSKYFYWTLVNYGVWISKKKHPESQLTYNPIAEFSLKIKFAKCSATPILVKSKKKSQHSAKKLRVSEI